MYTHLLYVKLVIHHCRNNNQHVTYLKVTHFPHQNSINLSKVPRALCFYDLMEHNQANIYSNNLKTLGNPKNSFNCLAITHG